MRFTRSSTDTSREPVGIVIADGGTPPQETRFLAYVWGPVPDELEGTASDQADEPLALATAAS